MTSPNHSKIDEYIKQASVEAQEKLLEMREILKEVAPDAIEDMKWGSPVFVQKRILFSFRAYKTHLNFMPTRTSLEPFKEELKDYTTGKDTIQFPYDQPLPKSFIQKIARHRINDILENDSLWMH